MRQYREPAAGARLIAQRELAVRRALGSSRARLVRLLLTESLMLRRSAARGRRGDVWLLAMLLTHRAERPAAARRRFASTRQVVAFTGVVSVADGAAVRHAAGAAVLARRRERGAQGRHARRVRSARGWLRSTLVVVEFALAVVLLVGAALLVRSFWRVQHVELGFEPANVLTAKLWLPQPNDPDQGRYSHRTTGHQARLATYEEILRRAAALPGVTAAAAAESLPFDGSRSSVVFTAEGTEGDDRSRVPTAQYTLGVGRAISR